jgi:hypothetical protein
MQPQRRCKLWTANCKLDLSLGLIQSLGFLFFLIKKETKKSRAVENSLKICAGA